MERRLAAGRCDQFERHGALRPAVRRAVGARTAPTVRDHRRQSVGGELVRRPLGGVEDGGVLLDRAVQVTDHHADLLQGRDVHGSPLPGWGVGVSRTG
ncbi:hypothetical protein SDC9_170734 [bioreactor metagenome]|uniref:Uncharacterized protein n=1 Tax=bioreactor metagenome TaxID=1076179 RepID=A0A645GB45_9ZZZZ